MQLEHCIRQLIIDWMDKPKKVQSINIFLQMRLKNAFDATNSLSKWYGDGEKRWSGEYTNDLWWNLST